MTLAVSPEADPSEKILASGIPVTPSIKFWSLSHAMEEAQSHLEEPMANISTGGGRSIKAKVTSIGADQERKSFLSGLMEEGDEDEENTE